MKKILFATLALISSYAFAQKYEVTPVGLRDSEDVSKSFLVINAEGKTAQQLYDETIKYINKNYKNPSEVIKGDVKGEYLKFETYAPEFISLKNSFKKEPFNAKYTTEISFKDGRVKYEIISLQMTNNVADLNFTGGGLSFFIYNKKGELKREQVKYDIEKYFNTKIESIKNSLQGKSDNNNDDW